MYVFTHVCMYLCIFYVCIYAPNGCNHDITCASSVLEWLFCSKCLQYHNGSTCYIHISILTWTQRMQANYVFYIISRPKIFMYITQRERSPLEPPQTQSSLTSHPHGCGAPDMRQASIGTFPANGHRLENHAAGTALRWGC